MDLEEAQSQFLRIRPALEEICSDLVLESTNMVRDARIVDAEVSGRVKTGGSFSAKVVLKGKDYQPDPLARMTDKVGLRVEVLHLDDIESIRLRVCDGLLGDVLKEEDKRASLGTRKIGYQGVHFDLRPRLPESVPAEWGVIELQVRTMAQGVWARADHEIAYKAPIEVPKELQRRLTKMTVFMETFDEEVRRVRNEVMTTEGYPEARLLNELAGQRARLGRSPERSSPALTYRIVTQLLGDDISPVEVAHDLDDWVERNEDQLKNVLARYEGIGRQFYVDRPEGLLAFFLISRDKYELADRWRAAGHEDKLLNDLFVAWGEALPDPDAL